MERRCKELEMKQEQDKENYSKLQVIYIFYRIVKEYEHSRTKFIKDNSFSTPMIYVKIYFYFLDMKFLVYKVSIF